MNLTLLSGTPELEIELNKQKLACNNESIIAWEAFNLKQKECSQVRKSYNSETAWNPKRAVLLKILRPSKNGTIEFKKN